MKLNRMNEIPISTKLFDTFGGYNRTDQCAINEGAEMRNMSSEKYPALSPRVARGELARSKMVNTLTSIIVNGALYSVETLADGQATIARYTDDGWKTVQPVPKNAKADELVDSFAWTFKKNYGERYFVEMGAYIVVFPDKLMFNTQEMTQSESGHFKVDVYALEHERTSVFAAVENGQIKKYRNGHSVSLTKLGGEVQNAWNYDMSWRILAASREKNPDASNAESASYVFSTMLDGSPRPAGWSWSWDGWTTGKNEDTGLPYYTPKVSYDGLLDVSGALYFNPNEKPLKLYELSRKVGGSGNITLQWEVVSNPVVKILSNSAILWPTGDTTTADPGLYYAQDGTRATNGIGVGLSVGDVVTINREVYKTDEAGNRTEDSPYKDKEIFGFEHTVLAVGEDYIVVDADLTEAVWSRTSEIGDNYVSEIIISRKAPEMDFVCEYNNRLYGCSSANHEIYASKLGDPKAWYSYQGISTDSYAATVGTDGDFTGCTAYGGNVYFFKEDVIHRLYGNAPSNFQLVSYDVPGVAKGSAKSLREVGGILYYLSPGGVMAYDGNYPVSIHSVFDGQRLKNGVAGRWQNKYYLSAQDESDAYHLLVYDSARQMWHREDDLPVKAFEEYENHLLAAVSDKIFSLTGGFSPHEEKVEWRFVSGVTGAEDFNNEHISKMMLRIMADAGTRIKVYLQYDGGEWIHAFSTTATAPRPFTIKTIPRRCDTLRYRVDGHGYGKILSACIYTEEGSELNV